MGIFSALLALSEGNLPVTGGSPSQRPVTRSFDVFFDLRLNKRMNNNRDAGDLRHHRTYYDVAVMENRNGSGSEALFSLRGDGYLGACYSAYIYGSK